MNITETPEWAALEKHYAEISGRHLRELFAEDPGRAQSLTVQAAELFLDYSKNRITAETIRLLVALAERAGLRERIDAMFRGEHINVSEDRAVLHVALRLPRDATLTVDGQDVVHDVHVLLTAPLLSGGSDESSELLRPTEFQRVARLLLQMELSPGDLLGVENAKLVDELKALVDSERLRRLLARGFQLSQAVEHWGTRSIWVVSHRDANYPQRIKDRLKETAPPVMYGCGDVGLAGSGGLAVVGSRDVSEWLVEYTEAIGRLAASARTTIVSGGARGIDQAAMRGAMEAGGRAVGILCDSLERASLHREHLELLMERQLLLISPYDPSAGFNIGQAMQRNKLIYALSDAALVVNSDLEKGGTWAGAVEQLEKFHFGSVYVRSEGETSAGLEALQRKGAIAVAESSDG